MAYPRDMVGYRRTPPQANWPNGAKLALQFIVAFEESFPELGPAWATPIPRNFISKLIGGPAAGSASPTSTGKSLF